MDPESLNLRLSRISTVWEDLARAELGSIHSKTAAQEQFMKRYHRAIYRYLLGALRDPDAADEVFQEFALEFLRGGLRHADPNRGKFRNFVKGVLIHLVSRYHKRQRARPELPGSEIVDPATPAEDSDKLDREFTENWRCELLAHTWSALSAIEQETGQPFHSVLRFRSEHPKMPSSEMAEQLTGLLKPTTAFTDTGIRKLLQRAREKFADLLLDEVAQSLENPNIDDLEQELIDLGLLVYCQPSLARRRSLPKS